MAKRWIEQKQMHRKSVGLSGIIMRRKIKKYAGDYAGSWLHAADQGMYIETNKHGPEYFRTHNIQSRWDIARFYHHTSFQIVALIILSLLMLAFIIAPWIFLGPLVDMLPPMDMPSWLRFAIADWASSPFQTRCQWTTDTSIPYDEYWSKTCYELHGMSAVIYDHPIFGPIARLFGLEAPF